MARGLGMKGFALPWDLVLAYLRLPKPLSMPHPKTQTKMGLEEKTKETALFVTMKTKLQRACKTLLPPYT